MTAHLNKVHVILSRLARFMAHVESKKGNSQPSLTTTVNVSSTRLQSAPFFFHSNWTIK